MAKIEVNNTVYYQDSTGKLIPEELVKPQEIVKDALIDELVTDYLEMRKSVQETKAHMLESIAHYKELVAASYGVSLKSKKGAITLTSLDGKYKVEIASNTIREFNENINVAKEVLDEYLDEELASAGVSNDLRVLVSDAFRLRQGELDFRAIWNLTKLDIRAEKFAKAVEIIKESIVTREGQPSLRVYIKNKNGGYTYLPTDFATLETPPITVKDVTEDNAAEGE